MSIVPPPEWGKPYKCAIYKDGADYTVWQMMDFIDMEGDMPRDKEQWMLVDAVGSVWDEGYNFYLKHRYALSDQVDADGKPTSAILCAANIKVNHHRATRAPTRARREPRRARAG